MQETSVLTPALMYRAAVVVAVADVAFAALLTWRIGTEGLRRARASVPMVAGVFWLGVWMTVHTLYWEPVYSHVFPAWSRWVIPPVYGLGFAGAAAAWRWLALRAPRLAVPVFIAL